MKYVIKDLWGTSYVSGIDTDKAFRYTDDLAETKRFNTIHDAIEAIVQRSLATPVWINNFTISGIKEVSMPRYEEVIL